VKAVLGVSSGGSTDGSTGGSAGGSTDGGTDGGGTTDGGATGGTSGGISGIGLIELFMLIATALVGLRRRLGDREMLQSWARQFVAASVMVLGIATTTRADDADFQARCSAPGVIKCVGFDSPAEISPGVNLFRSWDKQYRGMADTSIKSSGASSLRFEVPPFSAANTSGYSLWDMGQQFGPGSTFYVQFRQRVSQAMLDTDFQSDGWKQIIIHREGASCGNVELTTQNQYNRGFPIMYTDCGSRSMKETLGGGDYRLQQGDYECFYKTQPAGCATYRANQWMTFSYRVTIGEWGTATSSIYAWIAYEGEPLKQWIKRDNFLLKYGESPADTFSKIQLTPYQSKKDPAQDHPVGYVWYDELIVSTQPIAGPDGSIAPTPIGDSVPPAPPAGLQFQF
jgi:hypothetical protein